MKIWRAAPPTLPGAILTHPFQIALGVLFVLIGLSLALATLFGVGNVTRIQTLPEPIWIGWAAALLVGGPAMIAGVLRDSTGGRATERAGLYLVASAWASYALVMISTQPLGGLIGFGMGATLSTACLLRAKALRKVDRVVAHVARVAAEEETSA